MFLAAEAARQAAAKHAQDECWRHGFTRRRFLAGAGLVGVAALGSQFVSARVAYGAPGNTVVLVFLRGGADSLRILVPASDTLGAAYLRATRPDLVASAPIALRDGWAMNRAMAPLLPFWNSGEVAFVPAVSADGISRSHFDAQQWLESGGTPTSATGWLDRMLTQLGPGTTFRALAEGYTLPASMTGDEPKLSMSLLKDFRYPFWDGTEQAAANALTVLYRDTGTLGEDVVATLAAVATAERAAKGAAPRNGAVYPAGDFGRALKDVATLLRAEVGLQVATVDVGGWDTHTDEARDLDGLLASFSATLAAFLTDLGAERRSRVSVVVMSEFGRRVEQNASGGADHGHGGLMMVLGGGITGAAVHGRWQQLSDAVLDSGDVPALNHPFDVLGEVVQKRLEVGSLAAIFPGHSYAPLGVATSSARRAMTPVRTAPPRWLPGRPLRPELAPQERHR